MVLAPKYPCYAGPQDVGTRCAVASWPTLHLDTATIDPVRHNTSVKACEPADRSRALIDAHVHLHKLFPRGAFFDHAAANFDAVRRRLHLSRTTPSCLLLADPQHDNAFGQLAAKAGRAVDHWQVASMDEPASLLLHRADGAQLIVVAGRQIVTRERLEVLALGTTECFTDGQGVNDVLRQVDDAGAAAVLPWGFGKWMGQRGSMVRRLIQGERRGALFLGDNGGRWHCGPRPRLFDLARGAGVCILPGSDPLPFANQVRKPGSFGFVLHARLNLRKPAAGILWSLRRMQDQPQVFGEGESLLRFLRVQLGMQIRKRLGEVLR